MARTTNTTHIALLRGINVGGKNKLPMPKLIKLFEDAGCDDVRHYIQSGNIIFTAPPQEADQLPVELEKQINTKFKLNVPVIIRSAKELRSAIACNPFIKRGVDESELHLVFLADMPAKQQTAALDSGRSPGDSFIVKGAEIYLHLPSGVARSKLTNVWFDSKLNTISTVRNWRTVLKLAELSAA